MKYKVEADVIVAVDTWFEDDGTDLNDQAYDAIHNVVSIHKCTSDKNDSVETSDTEILSITKWEQ